MGDEGLGEVGRELRRLRSAAGLSGVELAGRAEVPQPTVSRVERGQRVSDAEVVVGLFGALDLPAAEFGRLAAQVRSAYAASESRRVDAGVSFRRGAGVELERAARVVSSFESLLIPRLLRTAAYERALSVGVAGRPQGSESEVRGSADAGPGRETAALDLADGEREFVFVVAEGVLRTWPAGGEFMPAQLGHLVELSGLAKVRLGVLPLLSGHTPALPGHGFTIYDTSAVSVATFTRELTLTAAPEVGAYVELFGALARTAVYGDEARKLVERAREDLENTLRAIH